ncbi:MAG: MFS transporter [Synergistaceae bacterium]|jgi:MFS family permease|nr:MFS transporter [Synergistaceae bacterium]
MNKADAHQLPPPRNFRLMVAGQIVTVFGASLLRFALSLYVLDITGRADLFAALLAVSSVPILLAPIGGAVSDRFNRKNLMVLYDAVCCAVSFGFLLVMLAGHASVFAVGAVMVILGIVGAMETPNGTACIPQLVAKDKLAPANGVIQTVQSLSEIIAPVAGGILYGAAGLRLLVAISGAAFALAAMTEMFIKIPFVKRERSAGMARMIGVDLKDGFAYVWKDSFIRNLMVIAALLNLILVPCFIVAVPVVLRITLNSGDTLYGVGMGIIETAMILGALSIGIFRKRMRVGTIWRWVLGIALLFAPLALSVTPLVLRLGFLTPFALFLLCISAMAAVTTILSIFVITRIQAKTPDENLGKVMAIIQAVAQCAAPVGQIAYGFMFERLNTAVYIPLLLAGLLIAGITIVSKITLK